MKMKRKNIKYILIFSFIGIFMSCDKDLDLSPLHTISDGTFWKSASDFEKAANAFYGSLGGHGNGTRDQNSDITVGAGTNGTSNGSLTLEGGPGWGGSYSAIRAATKITENYDIAVDIQAETARYAAEARFFRARTYANLVRTFGDVPLVKRTLDLESEELDAPRAPRADVVAYILEDLDWAIANLPEQSELNLAVEDGRVTKGAALALKSRIGLFEGTWAKYHSTGGDVNGYLDASIDASQKLIGSGEYDLYTEGGPNVNYRNLFLTPGQGSSESILASRFSEEIGRSHNTTRWIWTKINSPTKVLADMYICTDGLPIDKSPLFQGYDTMTSEFENRDPRMNQTFHAPNNGDVDLLGDVQLVPNIGRGGNGSTSSGYRGLKFFSDDEDCQRGQCFYDYMVMRYAEVLLNLAEALYERNGSITDAELDMTINKLRDRVGVAHLTNSLTTTNGLAMLWQIRNERTVELAYEGFRFDDLRRWKESENFLPMPLLGVKFIGSEFETTPPNAGITQDVDSDGFIIADPIANRSFDQRLYLFPVPIGEIQLNPNLTQNPGW